MDAVYRVDTFESERGWGRSFLDSSDFRSKQEALDYVKLINSQNNLPQTSDYYIFATEPYLVDLAEEQTD